MPIFPTYQGVSTSIATQRTPELPSDPATKQLGALGQATEQLGNTLGQVMQKRQALDDEAMAMQQYMKASSDLSDLADSFEKPEIGRNARETFSKVVEQKRAEWFKGLTPGAAARLEQHLSPKLIQYRSGASKIENRIHLNDYQAGGVKASMQFVDAASRITDFRDGKDTDEYKALESYYSVGEKNGYYTPQEKEHELNKALIAASVSRVTKIANSSDKNEILNLLDLYDLENGSRPPKYMAVENPAGLVEKGNINIMSRPRVKNADGSVSTVRSMSFQDESGKEVLVPTVSEDGRIMSDREAIDQYRKTGRNLGKFDTPEHATAYAEQLHQQQESLPDTKKGGTFLRHIDPIKRNELEQTLKNRLEHLNNEEIRKKNQERVDTERMNADLSKSTEIMAEQKLRDPAKYGPLTHEWLDLAGEVKLIDAKDLETWHSRLNKVQVGGAGATGGYGNPQLINRLSSEVYTTVTQDDAKRVQAEVLAGIRRGDIPVGEGQPGTVWLNHLEEKVAGPKDEQLTPAKELSMAKRRVDLALDITSLTSSPGMKAMAGSVREEAYKALDDNAKAGYPKSSSQILDEKLDGWKARLVLPGRATASERRRALGLPVTQDPKAMTESTQKAASKALEDLKAAPQGPEGEAIRYDAIQRLRDIKRLVDLETQINYYAGQQRQSSSATQELKSGSGGSGGPLQGPRKTK